MKIIFAVIFILSALIFQLTPLFAEAGPLESYLEGLERGSAGDLNGARASFEEALSVDSGYSPSERSLEAVTAAEEGRISHGSAARDIMAAKLHYEGRSNEAIIEYRAVLEGEPDFTYAYLSIGQLELIEGEAKQALKSFEQALIIDPMLAIAHVGKASALAYDGRTIEAMKSLERAIEIDPEEISAYSLRGSIHMSSGLIDEALKDFTRAIELYPRDRVSLSSRGYIYMVKMRDKGRGCIDWKNACRFGDCDNFRRAMKAGFCN